MRSTHYFPFQTACLPALFLALFILSLPLLARPKTDVLVMRNGDRITCEIKSLNQGQLSIKTAYTTGTIPIDWAQVERIETVQFFKVEMQDGQRYSGTIKREPTSAETEKEFVIVDDGNEERVAMKEVVLLDQLERSWISNIKGSIDGGFDFTKSNNRTSYVLNGSLTYKTPRRQFQTTLNSTITAQEGVASTEAHVLDLGFSSDWKRNWFTGALGDFTRSDELNLALRSTLGGGVGRYMIHTNRTNFRILGGMVYTIENFQHVEEGEAPTKKSLEGLVDVNFDIFRFDSTQATAYLRFFPSITQKGRIRAVYGVDYKLDLIGDLYWKLSYWNSLDNQPPEETSGSDATFSTTIGWSF